VTPGTTELREQARERWRSAPRSSKQRAQARLPRVPAQPCPRTRQANREIGHSRHTGPGTAPATAGRAPTTGTRRATCLPNPQPMPTRRPPPGQRPRTCRRRLKIDSDRCHFSSWLRCCWVIPIEAALASCVCPAPKPPRLEHGVGVMVARDRRWCSPREPLICTIRHRPPPEEGWCLQVATRLRSVRCRPSGLAPLRLTAPPNACGIRRAARPRSPRRENFPMRAGRLRERTRCTCGVRRVAADA
jgi:hypothetical protein